LIPEETPKFESIENSTALVQEEPKPKEKQDESEDSDPNEKLHHLNLESMP
jgi:hypothetical protein